VYIPDNPSYTFGPDFSVGFWFNANGQSGGVFLGQDEGGGELSKWFIDYGYGTPGAFEIHINGPSRAFLPSNPVDLPQGWNQLTLTKSDSTYTFYLNGVNIGSQTFSGTFPEPASGICTGR
jgi:Concanavalin A-like lectin/glucanases superfamily